MSGLLRAAIIINGNQKSMSSRRKCFRASVLLVLFAFWPATYAYGETAIGYHVVYEADGGPSGTTTLDTISVHGSYDSGGIGGGGITDLDRVTVIGTRPDSGGGGSFTRPNFGTVAQPTRDAKVNCADGEGNPVMRMTGNKVEPETDFVSSGEMGLYLERTYNHYWSAVGLFGSNWISNFDYSLVSATSNGKDVLWLQYPDGRRLKFIYDTVSTNYLEDKAQPIAWARKNANGTFTVRNEQNGTETYGVDGHITELRNEHGIAWVFAYSGQYLQRVTHTSGRFVSFVWTGGQVTQVTDPAGNIYRYTYTANVFGTGRGRLASTILPATPATTVSYHYEDSRYPGGLTGKSFNGIRYSNFAYDDKARAISTEHSGSIERFSFVYAIQASENLQPPPAPPPPGGFHDGEENGGWCEYRSGTGKICHVPEFVASRRSRVDTSTIAAATSSGVEVPTSLKVVVTNPLGRKTDYLYVNDRLTSVTGQPSSHCASSYRELSYSAAGYPNVNVDFEGHASDFDYDPQGHLVKKVEAAGEPVARTTTYGWDLVNNRLLSETISGLRQTNLTYDAKGRVTSVSVKNLSSNGIANQVRTTTYTYTLHANGLLASEKRDGPLPGSADTVTTTFSTAGDIASVTNSLGHSTVYAGYNGLGYPGTVTGSNGEKTSFTYDGRGRVLEQKSYRDGGTQTTHYDYDGFGRLAAVISPEGRKHGYRYDVAGRKVSEYETRSDGSFNQIEYTYNKLSQPLTVETQRAFTQPLQGTQP